MNFRFFAFLAALSAPTYSLASSENIWIIVAESDNGSIWKIRSEDFVNRQNYNPTVWVESDHKKNKTVPYRSSKTLYKFDCKSMKYYILQDIVYAANGSVIRSSEGNEYRSYYAAPETMIEGALKASCPKNIE